MLKQLFNVEVSFILGGTEQEEKKTEHTIIAHTSRNAEHQNIHVMLSYAKIMKHK